MSITLEKGQKINLNKKSDRLGEISVNLNWNSENVHQGFFSRLFGSKGIDLDLGCLYELKNGNKGVVQALGNCFGSLKQAPYVSLDGDDRSGDSAEGETLRINGDEISKIKRILVFTYIYEGVPNWKETNGVVTIKYPHAEDVIIRMDAYDKKLTMCALAMFENVGDETFSVQKLVNFYPSHRELDKAFNWNLSWVVGRK
ncbi:TerD family protein [bacterium]|nr:TerD family protein [bacterium]